MCPQARNYNQSDNPAIAKSAYDFFEALKTICGIFGGYLSLYSRARGTFLEEAGGLPVWLG
jgi:hypothetical protein